MISLEKKTFIFKSAGKVVPGLIPKQGRYEVWVRTPLRHCSLILTQMVKNTEGWQKQ